ncbi:hypothetical protein OF83DRAFT_1133742, partial [Amylostereum chailletii]
MEAGQKNSVDRRRVAELEMRLARRTRELEDCEERWQAIEETLLQENEELTEYVPRPSPYHLSRVLTCLQEGISSHEDPKRTQLLEQRVPQFDPLSPANTRHAVRVRHERHVLQPTPCATPTGQPQPLLSELRLRSWLASCLRTIHRPPTSTPVELSPRSHETARHVLRPRRTLPRPRDTHPIRTTAEPRAIHARGGPSPPRARSRTRRAEARRKPPGAERAVPRAGATEADREGGGHAPARGRDHAGQCPGHRFRVGTVLAGVEDPPPRPIRRAKHVVPR